MKYRIYPSHATQLLITFIVGPILIFFLSLTHNNLRYDVAGTAFIYAGFFVIYIGTTRFTYLEVNDGCLTYLSFFLFKTKIKISDITKVEQRQFSELKRVYVYYSIGVGEERLVFSPYGYDPAELSRLLDMLK